VARIRIVDEWLRSPVSGPSRHRAVMVVADSWSEQRVLMRAFAAAHDQTRPTIVLHGAELSIGPAGTDPHGSWGIHVEPPADGRAQELRAALELAARRLAGSKGNPPRLADEAPRFDEKPTGQWAPGTPPDVPLGARTRLGYYEPAELAPPAPPVPWASPAPGNQTVLAEAPRSQALEVGRATVVANPSLAEPAATRNPAYDRRARRPTPAAAIDGSRTRPGFAPSEGAPLFSPGPVALAAAAPSSPTVFGAPSPFESPFTPPAGQSPFAARQTPQAFGSVPAPPPAPRGPLRTADGGLARLVGHTMPLGFRLDDAERAVLNELGKRPHLTAGEVGALAGVADGVAWMEHLMLKLGEHGLDLVAPGPAVGAEPTYVLRR
jgi:hypothetical protein